jgi:hypothetical protein
MSEVHMHTLDASTLSTLEPSRVNPSTLNPYRAWHARVAALLSPDHIHHSGITRIWIRILVAISPKNCVAGLGT